MSERDNDPTNNQRKKDERIPKKPRDRDRSDNRRDRPLSNEPGRNLREHTSTEVGGPLSRISSGSSSHRQANSARRDDHHDRQANSASSGDDDDRQANSARRDDRRDHHADNAVAPSPASSKSKLSLGKKGSRKGKGHTSSSKSAGALFPAKHAQTSSARTLSSASSITQGTSSRKSAKSRRQAFLDDDSGDDAFEAAAACHRGNPRPDSEEYKRRQIEEYERHTTDAKANKDLMDQIAAEDMAASDASTGAGAPRQSKRKHAATVFFRPDAVNEKQKVDEANLKAAKLQQKEYNAVMASERKALERKAAEERRRMEDADIDAEAGLHGYDPDLDPTVSGASAEKRLSAIRASKAAAAAEARANIAPPVPPQHPEDEAGPAIAPVNEEVAPSSGPPPSRTPAEIARTETARSLGPSVPTALLQRQTVPAALGGGRPQSPFRNPPPPPAPIPNEVPVQSHSQTDMAMSVVLADNLARHGMTGPASQGLLAAPALPVAVPPTTSHTDIDFAIFGSSAPATTVPEVNAVPATTIAPASTTVPAAAAITGLPVVPTPTTATTTVPPAPSVHEVTDLSSPSGETPPVDDTRPARTRTINNPQPRPYALNFLPTGNALPGDATEILSSLPQNPSDAQNPPTSLTSALSRFQNWPVSTCCPALPSNVNADFDARMSVPATPQQPPVAVQQPYYPSNAELANRAYVPPQQGDAGSESVDRRAEIARHIQQLHNERDIQFPDGDPNPAPRSATELQREQQLRLAQQRAAQFFHDDPTLHVRSTTELRREYQRRADPAVASPRPLRHAGMEQRS